MFSSSPELHGMVPEPMMTSSPPGAGHGHLHPHGGQSQFLPGYLLGDSSSHGMTSPRLWSQTGLSPGHKSGHSSGRTLSRTESLKGRSGGPPIRGLMHSSTADTSLSNMGSPAQMRTPGMSAARVASPGPPTTGLLGTPIGLSRGDLSMNQSHVIPSSPSQMDPFYTQGESLRSDDILDETWVTVFGFPPGATSFILQQFSQYGNIVKHIPSAEGNWMHVHYQSKLQAKKALSKNGKVYGGRMMVGVLPCIDKHVMDNKENSEMLGTPQMTMGDVSSLRSPGTPIRPLTAAYAASRSEYEVLKNKQTPRKDNSIVSKVKEYMFGW